MDEARFSHIAAKAKIGILVIATLVPASVSAKTHSDTLKQAQQSVAEGRDWDAIDALADCLTRCLQLGNDRDRVAFLSFATKFGHDKASDNSVTAQEKLQAGNLVLDATRQWSDWFSGGGADPTIVTNFQASLYAATKLSTNILKPRYVEFYPFLSNLDVRAIGHEAMASWIEVIKWCPTGAPLPNWKKSVVCNQQCKTPVANFIDKFRQWKAADAKKILTKDTEKKFTEAYDSYRSGILGCRP